MPSEVALKENEINSEVEKIVDTSTLANTISKESNSQLTKTNVGLLKNDESENFKHSEVIEADDEIQITNKSKECNGSEKLTESENKEPSDEDKEILKERAEKLLLDGKRHLIIKDYQVAVDVLSEACSLFGTVYGELAEECAEAYFKYGCALLELGKEQINLVGLENKDEDSIQEESITEVINEQENATISEKNNEVENRSTGINEEMPADKEKLGKGEEKSTQIEKTNVSEEVLDNKETSADEEKSTEKEETFADTENSDEDEKPDEDDLEEDDANDFQVAWEMLDLAKVIYKNKDTEESKLKLAEVLIKCGEVSIEDEKFDTAIEDITESLQIRRFLLPEDSRIIAETLFELGVVQEMSGSSTQAIESLTEAVAVLEQRIKNLEILSDEKAMEEIADIKSIIPEIKEKMVDIKERKEATKYAIMAAMCGASNETTNGSSSTTTTKQASNISHLVRKRPKQEDSNGAVANKVPKLEESTAAKQQ